MTETIMDSTDSAQEMPQTGPQIDPNQLIAICKTLYRHCATDLEVDSTTDMMAISMERFVGWCVDNDQPMKDADEYTRRLGLRPDCCKTIDEIFRGSPWQCAAILTPIWFTVALQHRPPIENAVAFVHVAFTVGFRDEKVTQLQAAKEMAPGTPNTDGFLVAFMNSQATTMLQQIAHMGLDRLHDEFGQQVSERSQDIDRKEVPQPPPGIIGQ
jgi:hypothetical protein